MIDVSVLDVKPHPDQATNNPGCWAVQFRVSHAGTSRTFWRWHNVRTLVGGSTPREGRYVTPSNEKKPTTDEILAQFWYDTFGELNGFDFKEVA